MSLAHSNPYHSQPGPSTISPSLQPHHRHHPDARKVLFSGFPLDVAESDLRELLLADPLRLPPATTSVSAIFGPDGSSVGSAFVHVATDEDAERIRREYSGQQIDRSYVITVHHILKSTQTLPSAPSLASRTTKLTPPPKSNVSSSKPAPAKKPIGLNNDKPLGLKLLARMSKPGQGRSDNQQSSLLEKQRANRVKNAPGAALLNRLQSTATSHPAKAKPKSSRLSTGAQKVGRAKRASNTMDVDKPIVNKEKNLPKTQAELDDEMRAYERARRFA